MTRIFIIAAIFLIACNKPVNETPTYTECAESSGISFSLSGYWEISSCSENVISINNFGRKGGCMLSIIKQMQSRAFDTTYNDEISKIKSQRQVFIISEGSILVSGMKARFCEYSSGNSVVEYDCFFNKHNVKYEIMVFDSRDTYGRDKPEIEKLIGSIIIK